MLFYLQQCIKRCIPNTLKNIVRHNRFYTEYILPWRLNYQQKKVAKLDDETFLTMRHKHIFGYIPNFKNPQTFNEKIVHRMLYDRNPIYSALADKLKARIYIATCLQELQNTANISHTSNISATMSNATISINTMGGGQSKSNALDSKHSNLSDSVSYSNHLESLHKVDSATFNSNSLDSINLHSIDSATLSLLFMPIDDIQDKLFETNTCEFLPKIYGIYKNVEEIDFTLLPQSFVLKTNHDCGGVVLVQDKDEFLNNKKVFQESMDKLRKHLNTNYYTKTREWHYDSIEPRVFVEEMISDNGRDPATYKFHIFKSSQESYIQLTTDRFTNYKRIILDSNWNLAPFGFVYDNAKNDIPTKPKNLSMLQNIASILAQPFGYVRVDLYNANECIMVGELTFTHGGGTEKVVPNEWDTHLGNLWKYIYFSSCYAESKNDSK